MAVVFWSSVVSLFYIYLGYPILIGLIARLFPKPVARVDNTLPDISIIMSCYGELDKLAAKIENILSCDGAGRIKEILVGLDGVAPENNPVVTAHPAVRLIPFPSRRGKPSVLNDLTPMATGDVVIMMDVRQRLDRPALIALLENFQDPTIGVVSGELVFVAEAGDSADAASIDVYWKLEKWLRTREGQFASVPGATGALYAIRRALIKPLPAGAALDDVIIPMHAIAQGYRCIFEPRAKMFDRPAQDAEREAVRKRRTLAGCVQLLKWYPHWMLPFGHPIWWQFGSHKIARLFSPVFLLLAAVSCAALVGHPLYAALAVAQIAGYATATAGLLTRKRGIVRMAGVFLKMQGTLIQAWRDGLPAKNLALWTRA